MKRTISVFKKKTVELGRQKNSHSWVNLLQDASDIADMHRVKWRDSGVADEWMEVASDDVFLVNIPDE